MLLYLQYKDVILINIKDATEILFGIKITNKTNWIINLTFLILMMTGFLLLSKYLAISKKKNAEKWHKLEFSGIVDSVSVDKSNHATTSIHFSDGHKKNNFSQNYYYILKKNDSLFKIKNNDTVYYKRNNKIIKLD